MGCLQEPLRYWAHQWMHNMSTSSRHTKYWILPQRTGEMLERKTRKETQRRWVSCQTCLLPSFFTPDQRLNTAASWPTLIMAPSCFPLVTTPGLWYRLFPQALWPWLWHLGSHLPVELTWWQCPSSLVLDCWLLKFHYFTVLRWWLLQNPSATGKDFGFLWGVGLLHIWWQAVWSLPTPLDFTFYLYNCNAYFLIWSD